MEEVYVETRSVTDLALFRPSSLAIRIACALGQYRVMKWQDGLLRGLCATNMDHPSGSHEQVTSTPW